MKVLVITNLYPEKENLEEDKNTKAIHNIIKNWKADVEVIKTRFFPTRKDYKLSRLKLKAGKFLLENVKVHSISIFKIPMKEIYFTNTFLRYVNKMNFVPDVIVAHRLPSAKIASILAKTLNKPYIVGLHYSDISNKKKLEKNHKIVEQAELIACRSNPILAEFNKVYPNLSNKCFLASSGIEKHIIVNLNENLSKLQSWKEEKRPIKFITAANLISRKNIDINLKALALIDKRIEWTYTIIGDGPQMNELVKLSLDLGISERITFLGQKSRKEVLTHMQNSDIFIMVSSHETFGLTYIEAMAKGCIVVGAYNNGIDGIVKDGFNGFLCNEKCKTELKNTLVNIIKMDISNLITVVEKSYLTINNNTEDIVSQVYEGKVWKAFEKGNTVSNNYRLRK
ncbi:glycosyltransferase [Bacillus haikouensis]|nr:glycosyltransferase [Bacillus haikouensis]